jgi:hypothetical protein
VRLEQRGLCCLACRLRRTVAVVMQRGDFTSQPQAPSPCCWRRNSRWRAALAVFRSSRRGGCGGAPLDTCLKSGWSSCALCISTCRQRGRCWLAGATTARAVNSLLESGKGGFFLLTFQKREYRNEGGLSVIYSYNGPTIDKSILPGGTGACTEQVSEKNGWAEYR